jgi:CDGSH-type Zn-finger protein
MTDASDRRITVAPNGPLRVEGGVPLSRETIEPNADGESWRWRATGRIDAGPWYELCRCARSRTQPFCDDTCTATGWDGTETASHVPYDDQARIFPGAADDLADARGFCAGARFCQAGETAWALVRGDDSRSLRLLERVTGNCPSGRLVALRRGADGDRAAIELGFEPSIVLVEDAGRGVSGPVWVRGRVEVRSADDHPYEVRNRVTLCRCGGSSNKPFCDGSHVRVGFREGSVAASVLSAPESGREPVAE